MRMLHSYTIYKNGLRLSNHALCLLLNHWSNLNGFWWYLNAPLLNRSHWNYRNCFRCCLKTQFLLINDGCRLDYLRFHLNTCGLHCCYLIKCCLLRCHSQTHIRLLRDNGDRDIFSPNSKALGFNSDLWYYRYRFWFYGDAFLVHWHLCDNLDSFRCSLNTLLSCLCLRKDW